MFISHNQTIIDKICVPTDIANRIVKFNGKNVLQGFKL